jgi:hypothetical protein
MDERDKPGECWGEVVAEEERDIVGETTSLAAFDERDSILITSLRQHWNTIKGRISKEQPFVVDVTQQQIPITVTTKEKTKEQKKTETSNIRLWDVKRQTLQCVQVLVRRPKGTRTGTKPIFFCGSSPFARALLPRNAHDESDTSRIHVVRAQNPKTGNQQTKQATSAANTTTFYSPKKTRDAGDRDLPGIPGSDLMLCVQK